jgi:cytochrome b6-f complex iron-sulfur subunit
MMDMEQNDQPTRRGFLDWLIGLCTAATGAAMAIPGLAYLWPAAKGGGAAEKVEVAGAGQLPVGHSTRVQVGSKVVIVVRGRTGFKAFSAICTHLGCLVNWDTGRHEFLCPCHAAVFDENGRVVSGPPPAPLPEYDVKEVEGKVFVSAKA